MATRLIGPYDATAYGRLKIPTPMMLPITSAVPWVSPSFLGCAVVPTSATGCCSSCVITHLGQ
jgi:hypothetical protein